MRKAIEIEMTAIISGRFRVVELEVGRRSRGS